MRVADFIARRLQFLGLTDVYMVTGGAAMHLNDAFASVFPTVFIACIMNKVVQWLLKVMHESKVFRQLLM